jgi:DNA-binding NtrC family response regulator
LSGRKTLLVDDNQENLDFLSLIMERNGCEFDTADGGVSALARLGSTHYDIVITDLMMPVMNGLELLDKIKQEWPETEVVFVTAYGSIPTAIEAIKRGAYTYLLRPFEPDEVAVTVRKIFEILDIRSQNSLLREELDRALKYDRFIGGSQAIQKVYKMVENVAKTSSTALITGDSGTGKELIARAIHSKSPRAKGPFIKVSCAALPETLLESELFGHEKGSFTGAVAQRKGRFELADKGTLFLDEIGEIPLSVQVKLLRVIQEREFERIGGTKTIKTDTRIISATNKDLKAEVERGTFREDLYYRLNVITIDAPPLRDRVQDIPLLAYHFLERYALEMNKPMASFTDEAMACLTAYDWPGNVRELQNVIERAVALAQGSVIGLSDFPENIRGSGRGFFRMEVEAEPGGIAPLRVAKSAWEKHYIERALTRYHGNISHTAEAIELARKNLQEKIRSYGIDVQRLTSKKMEE